VYKCKTTTSLTGVLNFYARKFENSYLLDSPEWSGVFFWSIRKLKLSILPFLEFDLEKSLEYLEKHGFIKKFSQDRKDYGYVYNFTRYQAISGNEKLQALKYPAPTEKELERDYTDTVPIQSQDSPETIPGQDSDNTESPDSDSDIGHRT
jgi:hypothetical protein